MLRKVQTPMMIHPAEGGDERLRKTVKRNKDERRVNTMPPIMQIESLNCFLPRIPRYRPETIKATPKKIFWASIQRNRGLRVNP